MKKLSLLLIPLLLSGCGKTTNSGTFVSNSSSQTVSYTIYTREENCFWSINYQEGGKLVIEQDGIIIKEFEFGKWEIVYTVTSSATSDQIYDYGDYCIVHSYYRK